MTTTGKIDLSGFREYLEKLAAYPDLLDASVGEAVLAGAQVTLAEMVRLVPRSDEDKPHLADQLSIGELQQDGNFFYVEVGLLDLGENNYFIYGFVVEYGSARQAATPYIRPGLENKKGAVRQSQYEVLKKSGVI